MKKMFFIFLATVCFLFSSVNSSLAATYIIQPGDSLDRIAQITGNSIDALIMINGIENPKIIRVGKKLTYLSAEEKKLAKDWCKERFSNSFLCKLVYSDLKNNRIIYTNEHGDESGFGTHFSLVIKFAEMRKEDLRLASS